MARVVVVGAGVAGLTVAYDIARQRPDVDLVILDSASRPGGKVWASPLAGTPVDRGADAFLARVPSARELIDELGLTDQIVYPEARRALLWLDDQLRPIPAESVLGVPLDLDHLPPGTLSPAGLARAHTDLDRPGVALDDDCAVGPLIRDRLGDEVFERLVEPLLGGINAGDADKLSLRVGASQLAAAAEHGGSLIRSLRELTSWVPPTERAPGAAAAPVFLSLRGGAGLLTRTLADRLGSRLKLDSPVDRVSPRADGRWSVTVDDHDHETDQVVVATPAHVATRQLRALTQVSETLSSLDFASVAVVILALPARTAGPWDDAISGVLVPRSAGRLLTAVSFGSAKWPHWSPGGEIILRASVGRIDDTRHLALSDEELTHAVRADLADIIGLDVSPEIVETVRWPAALAQFPPGHLERMAELEQQVRTEHAGLHLVGRLVPGGWHPNLYRPGPGGRPPPRPPTLSDPETHSGSMT